MVRAFRLSTLPNVILDLGSTEVRVAIIGKERLFLPVLDLPTCLKSLLKQHLAKVLRAKPRLFFLVDPDQSEQEKASLINIGLELGASEACCVIRPLAQLQALEKSHMPRVALMMDIRTHKVVVTLVREGDILSCQKLNTGSEALDWAFLEYVRRNLNLMMPVQLAQYIKKEYGQVSPTAEEGFIEIRGRDVERGRPQVCIITPQECREAWSGVLQQWAHCAQQMLYQTPLSLVETLRAEGIYLAGGGALLKGLDAYLSQALNLCVTLIQPPLQSALLGAEKWIQGSKLR